MKKLLALLFIVSLAACSKEDDSTPSVSNTLSLDLSFVSGTNPLLFDSMMFTNAAGYTYSVSRLQFYISNIQLIKSDSSLVNISEYNYVDARGSSTLRISRNIPLTGTFIGMKMQLGLDSMHNLSNFLPATNDNINMAWPDPMGGGYHFLKMEGTYMDGMNTPGYAMHLGRNANLTNCIVYHPFILSAGSNQMDLQMDLNEWFVNPHIYDFNIDGNSSMGNMAAMMKLCQNGVDIFTIQ